MEYLKTMLNNLAAGAGSTVLRIVVALLILGIGLKLVKWLLKLIQKGKVFQKLEPSLVSFLSSIFGIVLRVLVVITAAGYAGLPITSFITVLASAGVAVGLALQGGLSNLAGGVMLLLFHPFKTGDYIKTADGEGTVEGISVFYTHLRTPDNRHLTLPNGNLTAATITNYSVEPIRRVDMEVSVGYLSDLETVKKTILEAVARTEGALSDPPPLCRLYEMGDHALKFALRVWCNTPSYWDVYYELNEQIKTALDEAGISIPFPQLDVHLDK